MPEAFISRVSVLFLVGDTESFLKIIPRVREEEIFEHLTSFNETIFHLW